MVEGVVEVEREEILASDDIIRQEIESVIRRIPKYAGRPIHVLNVAAHNVEFYDRDKSNEVIGGAMRVDCTLSDGSDKENQSFWINDHERNRPFTDTTIDALGAEALSREGPPDKWTLGHDIWPDDLVDFHNKWMFELPTEIPERTEHGGDNRYPIAA